MSGQEKKQRAGRNRTIELTNDDRVRLRPRLLTLSHHGTLETPPQGTVLGDSVQVARQLPSGFVDLLVLDPPYNLTKSFNGRKFAKRPVDEYAKWLDTV